MAKNKDFSISIKKKDGTSIDVSEPKDLAYCDKEREVVFLFTDMVHFIGRLESADADGVVFKKHPSYFKKPIPYRCLLGWWYKNK